MFFVQMENSNGDASHQFVLVYMRINESNCFAKYMYDALFFIRFELFFLLFLLISCACAFYLFVLTGSIVVLGDLNEL